MTVVPPKLEVRERCWGLRQERDPEALGDTGAVRKLVLKGLQKSVSKCYNNKRLSAL